ncbi:spore germination protein [Paenibacillus sp. DXFW5]|uniref:Spore germination protein n=1 Tax=Paenibacillus rhizolycopersici TaxID=2780073 RepID=A0ABS2GZW3_9BACL|nr:spore germination protein [Paenibacillus rhizolycopersici]MBM6994517.1 spore germination protein [Paenibacillus rhizolycopersici]
MKLTDRIRNRFEHDGDFIMEEHILAGRPVQIMGFKSLIDLPKTWANLQSRVREADLDFSLDTDSALIVLNKLGQIISEPDEASLLAVMTSGDLIICYEDPETYLDVVPVPTALTRSIEQPLNENVLQGSASAFNDDIATNIGLLKKELNTASLRTKVYVSGNHSPRKLALLYLEGQVEPALLREVMERLEANKNRDLYNLQRVCKALGFQPWKAVPKFYTTELPTEAAHTLRQGRVVLFLDRFPFAMILPALVGDIFMMENDRNYPILFMYLIRGLRIAGIMLNLIMPSLYVALVSVNPEVLRIELALSIAESRSGVPYPAFVETLLLLVVLELIIVASVRLPKSIGPTLTVVGGIILGQAVVEAKLVSSLLIIILAATTIANSAVVGFQNSLPIRLFKYLTLILASLFGVLGILSGLVIICAYLASVTTYGIPYLYFIKSKDDSNG